MPVNLAISRQSGQKAWFINQSVLKNVLMLYCTNASICNLAVDEMPQISLLLVIENQGNMFQEKNGDF